MNNINIIEYDLDCIETNKLARDFILGRLFRSSKINEIGFIKGTQIKEDTLFNIMIIAGNSNLKVCWIDQKLYSYFNRDNSIVHNYEGKDLLPYSRECIALLSSCNDEKILSGKYYFNNTFSARYLSKFDVDFSTTDRICKDLSKETWKIVK